MSEVFVFPASVGQESFWFMDQLIREASPFTVPVRFQLRGPVDPAFAHAALQEIVKRHEILRTTFQDGPEGLQQVVHEEMEVPFFTLDIRNRADVAQEAERIGTQEARAPFNLSSGPLFRGGLVQRAEQDWILHVTAHHTVCDGWSVGVIVQEFAEFYAALSEGRASALPELSVQFADYTLWEREMLVGPDMRQDVDFWRAQWDDLPHNEMPMDYARPAAKSWRGNIVSRMLPAEIVAPLQALARAENVSFFVVCLAAFQVFVARHSGQDDVALTVPVAGRNQLELEPLIGSFINTLVMRTELRGNPTFKELVARTRDTVAQAMAHAKVPFEILVRELSPERAGNQNPVTQLSFAHQRDFVRPCIFAGIELKAIPSCASGAIHDLNVFMVEREGQWRVSCDYSTDLFAEATAQDFLLRYEHVLRQCATAAEMRIERIEIATPQQRELILEKWNATQHAFPTGTVLDLFTASAVHHADKMAVEDADGGLSYRELSRASLAVAGALQKRGCRRGSVVGMALRRGPEAVAAILGIMRAGAAYVPLDVGYPTQRLALMIEDSGVRVVLTDVDRGNLPDMDGVEMWQVDMTATGEAVELEGPSPEDLAYVLFTSGSTGRPKGVEVTHGGLLNVLMHMRRKPGFEASDRLLAVTTLSFDISVVETLLPLICGGSIFAASREDVMDADKLMALMKQRGITVMQATPVTWRMLFEAGWRGDERIKVITGGEPFPAEIAKAWRGHTRGVWNLYGPTETTIYSTGLLLDAEPEPITIGRPVANTRCYIVDDHHRLLPPGVAGELWIAGAGLARGYCGQQELTREKFLPDCFSSEPGARMYRTGDLAKWLRDGRIQCFGRMDHQVKLRGFRIELEEIESVLLELAGVRQAVVGARGEGERMRLVAWVVAEQTVRTEAMRGHAAARLPDYMVPAQFVRLEALPTTPNGKIDRKALAVFEEGSGQSEPPRPGTETHLAELWQAALELEQLGREDHFFHAGGHSLLAVRLLGRINARFGTQLPLTYFYQYPTLAAMAAVIDEARGNEDVELETLLAEMKDLSEEEVARLLGGDHG